MVELLVVIGLIAILLALLLPAMHKARLQAQCVACQSNMRTIGQAMMAYSVENRGWLFPPDNGLDVPLDQRWFLVVLKPPPPKDPNSVDPQDWTPKIMLCPADDQEPGEYHSYLLNHHLAEHHIMYSSRPPANLTPSDVVVMGEKLTTAGNYYVETKSSGLSTYDEQVDEDRHGVQHGNKLGDALRHLYGSNYLYLDMHVGPRSRDVPKFGIDPWDFPAPGELPN